MPNCRDITEHASDYLDQNLSPWRRAGFRLHLLMCLYCRRHMKHLNLTVASLGKLAAEEEPAKADVENIVQRLKQQQGGAEGCGKGNV